MKDVYIQVFKGSHIKDICGNMHWVTQPDRMRTATFKIPSPESSQGQRNV